MYTVEMFGQTFDLNPVAFSLGGFDVYWYGIIIAVGFLAALIYGFRRAAEYEINTDKMIDVILIGTVGGVVGARSYYVLTTLSHYESFMDMIDIRDGGLAIYGGVIGALVCGGLVCLWRKINFTDMLDLAAPAFLIGQAIGRWGNFMNQEAFGSNTTLPWGMFSNGTYDHLTYVQETLAQQGVTVDPSLPVHPCFLYESLWCITGFIVIYYQYSCFCNRDKRQCIFELMVGPLKISQVLAATCVVVGLILILVFRIKAKKKKETTLETSTIVSE